jgi:hypothetical protein
MPPRRKYTYRRKTPYKRSTANRYFRKYKGRGAYKVPSRYAKKRVYKKRASRKPAPTISKWSKAKSVMKKIAVAGAAAALGYAAYRYFGRRPGNSYNIVGSSRQPEMKRSMLVAPAAGLRPMSIMDSPLHNLPMYNSLPALPMDAEDVFVPATPSVWTVADEAVRNTPRRGTKVKRRLAFDTPPESQGGRPHAHFRGPDVFGMAMSQTFDDM